MLSFGLYSELLEVATILILIVTNVDINMHISL